MITSIRIPILGCRRGYYLRWYYNGWHYWNFLSGSITYRTSGEKYRTTGSRLVALNSGMVTEAQISAIRTISQAREVYVYTDGGWAETLLDGASVVVLRNKFSGYEMELKLTLGSRKISSEGYSVGSSISIVVDPIPPDPDPPDPVENNVYVGRFLANGSGASRLFGILRTFSVARLSVGGYNIYPYLTNANYITLGVGEGSTLSSIRSMNNIDKNKHFVRVSDDSGYNDSITRFFINFGAMLNTKICIGEFNSAGTTIAQLSGDPLTLGISRDSTGVYDITHDVGHTNYIILGVGLGSTVASLRAMETIGNTSVRIHVSDDASRNDANMRFIIIWEAV